MTQTTQNTLSGILLNLVLRIPKGKSHNDDKMATLSKQERKVIFIYESLHGISATKKWLILKLTRFTN